MAENIYYNRLDISDEKRETSEEEIYKQIKLEELSVVEREKKSLICESCVSERLYGWYERVAVFFCFECEIYVCVNCLPKHEFHKGMKVWRKESERENERETSESDRMGDQGLSGRTKNKGKGLGKKTRGMRLEVEIERVEGEKSESERLEEECDGKISLLLDDLIIESETERIEKFENSHVSIIDLVEVKHELDRTGCWITGLCGQENKRLVVCDWNNDCIKIFKLGSHVLQRYIRFVGSDSKPCDVTEIDLKQNSTEPNLVSGSSSNISGTDSADPDKQCLIAVTLPGKRQIMFIDLSKKPAKAQKTIKTEKRCFSIQFYDDKIFTVCWKDFDFSYSVYIYFTDGDTLNKFDTGSYGYLIFGLDLAVVSGRVYLTDWPNNKVECRNVEGQLISEITIEGSRPYGISVDPDNNVYVCAQGHNKVYKLDADLTQYKSVLDQTTDYIQEAHALCYYRDKLFISHDWPTSLRNFVTVVRLL